MKGIFHPAKGYDWECPLSPPQESRELDPIEDRYYIEYIILHVLKNRRNPLVNLPMTKVTGLCLPCGQTASCDAFRIRLFA